MILIITWKVRAKEDVVVRDELVDSSEITFVSAQRSFIVKRFEVL